MNDLPCTLLEYIWNCYLSLYWLLISHDVYLLLSHACLKYPSTLKSIYTWELYIKEMLVVLKKNGICEFKTHFDLFPGKYVNKHLKVGIYMYDIGSVREQ